MGFHRRSAPTYFGGLPGGYDYINNPALNGDPGSPAPVDGKKSSGVNQGTYLIAFGEDATSSNSNRGDNALAENCDLLDDLFRTSQVVMRWIDGTAVGSVSSLVIPGDVYVGSPSDAPSTANDQVTRNRLVHVVDQNNNEIETSGSKSVVTLVHDGSSNNQVGVPATGFFNGPTINITPAIPNGVNYRIYYLARRNLNDIIKSKPSEFFLEQVRTAHNVSADVQVMLRTLHIATGGTWNGAWASTIDDLVFMGLDGRYRLGTAKPGTTPNADVYPLSPSGAGRGGWIRRDGPAVAIYSNDAPLYTDPTQALMKAVFTDTTQSRGSVGFMVEGSHQDGRPATYAGESDRFAGFASFLSTDVRRYTGSVHAANPYTRILAGATVTLATPFTDPTTGEAYVELPVGQYFRQTASGPTDIAIGHDLIRLRFTLGGNVVVRDYVMTLFGSSAAPTSLVRMRIRNLDGTVPNFTGATSPTVVEWLRWSVGLGEGAGVRLSEGAVINDPVSAHGFTVISPGRSLTGSSAVTPTAKFITRGPATASVAQFGYLDLGDYAPAVDIIAGDATTAGTLHLVRAKLDMEDHEVINATRLESTYGPHTRAGDIETHAVSSATSVVTLDLAFRTFKITCDNTTTANQLLDINTTAAPVGTELESMELTIFFSQGSGAGGTVETVLWPANFKFESISDRAPLTGSSKVTIWKAKYFGTNWYLQRLAYNA